MVTPPGRRLATVGAGPGRFGPALRDGNAANPAGVFRRGSRWLSYGAGRAGDRGQTPSFDTSRTAPLSALVAIAAYARSAAETLRSRFFGA